MSIIIHSAKYLKFEKRSMIIEKSVNIFQKYQHLLAFFVIYDSKLNIFRGWNFR